MKELGGKTGVLLGLDLPSAGRELILTLGQLSESEEKHLRLRGRQLTCGSLNGMRVRQSLPQPHIAQRGTSGRCSFWELGFRDCGATPGRGLQLTAERQVQREEIVVGNACGGKLDVHGSQAALLSHV